MKKPFLKLKLFIKQFFFGLRKADDILTSQDVSNLNGGVSIQQKKEATSLSEALLRGELTQEVKELRHRMYKIERETEYFTDKITEKLHKRTEKNYTIRKELEEYDVKNGYEVKLIQHNFTDGINTSDSLSFFTNNNTISGKDLSSNEKNLRKFTINVLYSEPSRVHIGRFIKSVKYKTKDEKHYVDISLSKYKLEGDVISSFILSKLNNTNKEELNRLDFLKISKIDFITFKCYKATNSMYYSFDNLTYEDFYEYDGNYYVTYRLEKEPEVIDMYEQYRVEELDKKYENKERKQNTITYSFDDFTQLPKQKTYTCQNCGKQTVKGKKVILENDPTMTEILDNEYIDYELSYQTYGEYLCSSCLKEKYYDPYIDTDK